MNNEEKILELLIGMQQEISGVKQKLEEHDKRFDKMDQEMLGIKYEMSGIKQEMTTMKQDNTKSVEMLARYMIDNTTRLERIEKDYGEKLESIEEKLDILKDMSSDNDFEIRRLKKKLIS